MFANYLRLREICGRIDVDISNNNINGKNMLTFLWKSGCFSLNFFFSLTLWIPHRNRLYPSSEKLAYLLSKLQI